MTDRSPFHSHTENHNFHIVKWPSGASGLPRIPLIDDLVKAPISPGSTLMVEFDPASQWYNASFTIAAGWLKSGGRVRYIACGQPTETVRRKLTRLGINTREHEGAVEGASARKVGMYHDLPPARLMIRDGYTATLGLKSTEAGAIDTVKVAELSPGFTQDIKNPELLLDSLRIVDDEGYLSRFNDERSWVEYVLTRVIPQGRSLNVITMLGYVSGLHGAPVYRQLEAAHDGIIDFKLEETGNESKNLIRIRSMRDVNYDKRWHPLQLKENGEVALAD